MTYGTEVVVPTEISKHSSWTENFDLDLNDQGLSFNLDILEIKRDKVQIRMVANQWAATQSYNMRVKVRRFKAEDLVLKKTR